MDMKEDRPDTYEAQYEFDGVTLTGEVAIQIVRSLWGLGYRQNEGDPIIWSYSGDFTGVYAEGRETNGEKAHRFLYDFHRQEQVDALAELSEVNVLIAIASAYEENHHDAVVTVEALQVEGGLDTALTHYRPCTNWSKGHWNNMLVRQVEGDKVVVKVVGIARNRDVQYDNNPFMRGDFHEKKVKSLFESLAQ